MSMFTCTKNPTFIDRIMAIVDQARVGDGMADAQHKKDLFDRIRALFHSPDSFDMDKAEAAAAAYALSPSGLPGMPSPKVDGLALMELARGLREGDLAEYAVTEPQYQQFIVNFCASQAHPPRRSGLTIDTEMNLPALQAFLKKCRALMASSIDRTKMMMETERQRMGLAAVGVELRDLSAMRSELTACSDLEKFQAVLRDWTQQFHVRSHMKVTFMLGHLEDLIEFLDVSIQAVSERMDAEEGGSMAGDDMDE
ncbi:hypothetical protein MRS44_002393 [Fusarium solani]|uniref:uncharacterized protein n=1 Tax=Fusarium solani TaxID=169388 RepID=UPI0032C42AE8|nr:hypothetical protein MRS44_002393 [Fusarium solani]